MNEVDLRELAVDRGETNPTRARRWRHLLTRYLLPLVLILGFVSLLMWASRDLVFPPSRVTVVPVFSTTGEVGQAGLPLFHAAGWIEPRPTPVRVAALAPGVVEQLLVVEDQLVKSGEPIAELVKDDAKLNRDRALAALELREAELEESRATLTAATTRFERPVHLQAALSDAEASLARIETQLKNLPFEVRRAEADFEATQGDYQGKLASRGIVAGVEIDIAKGRSAAAKSLVEELRDRSGSLARERSALLQRRDALKTQLELRAEETKAKDEARAKVRAANARVAEARVDVAEARLQLNRMTIVSPINGRVFRLLGHPGARLSQGMGHTGSHDGSTVVTLYRPEMLQVRVDVRFEDIPKVSLNQQVEINNPALESPLIGNVLYISSEADIQKNTLQVKVALRDPPPLFKPEMLVDVIFLSRQSSKQGQANNRIFVPRQLVGQEDGNAFVWLADQSENVARKQPIQTGRVTNNGLIEVISGLTVTSRVIAAGRDKLTDGRKIQITGEDANIDISSPHEDKD